MDGVKVKIPATSANLGPGFDCLGLALNLYNRLEVHTDDKLRIETEGDGAQLIPTDASNLTYQAMKRAYEAVGRECPGFFIRQISAIPFSKGLGSSASAIVGGLVAANALMGSPLDKHDLLKIACAIEGHPDNVTPCLFGGLTATVMDGTEIHFARTLPDERFCYAAMVPDFELPTKSARKALPDSYSKADTVQNVGRAVLMYAALEQGMSTALRTASRDKIHQPYRKPLIPAWDDVTASATDSGALAVCLSGAGPTIMAIFERQDDGFMHRLQHSLDGLPDRWKALKLECCQEGTIVKKGG